MEHKQQSFPTNVLFFSNRIWKSHMPAQVSQISIRWIMRKCEQNARECEQWRFSAYCAMESCAVQATFFFFPDRILLLRVLMGQSKSGHKRTHRGEAVSTVGRPRIAVAVPKIYVFMYKTNAFLMKTFVFYDSPQCFFFAIKSKIFGFRLENKAKSRFAH